MTIINIACYIIALVIIIGLPILVNNTQNNNYHGE